MQALADCLKYNRSLKHLDLGWNLIGDEGATALANVLSSSPPGSSPPYESSKAVVLNTSATLSATGSSVQLVSLGLGWNNISSLGGDKLLRSLRHNSCLVHLDLRHNRLGSNRLVPPVAIPFSPSNQASSTKEYAVPIRSTNPTPSLSPRQDRSDYTSAATPESSGTTVSTVVTGSSTKQPTLSSSILVSPQALLPDPTSHLPLSWPWHGLVQIFFSSFSSLRTIVLTGNVVSPEDAGLIQSARAVAEERAAVFARMLKSRRASVSSSSSMSVTSSLSSSTPSSSAPGLPSHPPTSPVQYLPLASSSPVPDPFHPNLTCVSSTPGSPQQSPSPLLLLPSTTSLSVTNRGPFATLAGDSVSAQLVRQHVDPTNHDESKALDITYSEAQSLTKAGPQATESASLLPRLRRPRLCIIHSDWRALLQRAETIKQDEALVKDNSERELQPQLSTRIPSSATSVSATSFDIPPTINGSSNNGSSNTLAHQAATSISDLVQSKVPNGKGKSKRNDHVPSIGKPPVR